MRPLKTQRAQFLYDNLDLPAAAQFEGAQWEYFQLNQLEDESTFRIETKSRQIAYSFLCAMEAVAEGILRGASSTFISINLEEAKEKIRYAHNVISALPPAMRPKLTTDNRTEVEFDNGARLMSLPATAPRGKAQMNVYIDEFAHVRDDAAIYTAALPMMTKGACRLRIGSSPMGASGRFWEVFKQEINPYPGYVRRSTPWWEVRAFCCDLRQARKVAPSLPTAERVGRFGNDRIQTIFQNLPVEDFQQEYECVFVDETTSWITWKEIREVQDSELDCYFSHCRDSRVSNALSAIDDFNHVVGLESVFGAGVDVGRTRNTTEIFLVGLSTLDSYPLRLAITLDNCDFDSQQDVLVKLLSVIPVAKMYIDQNGIGRNLAESTAKQFPVKAEGVDFTNATKRLWATDAKMLIQQRKTPLPLDRGISYQIHSIKRKVTASNNMVFDTERNAKHHADKFWAWALALSAANTETEVEEYNALEGAVANISRW